MSLLSGILTLSALSAPSTLWLPVPSGNYRAGFQGKAGPKKKRIDQEPTERIRRAVLLSLFTSNTTRFPSALASVGKLPAAARGGGSATTMTTRTVWTLGKAVPPPQGDRHHGRKRKPGSCRWSFLGYAALELLPERRGSCWMMLMMTTVCMSVRVYSRYTCLSGKRKHDKSRLGRRLRFVDLPGH